jgi:NADH:ubiquinone oxidoreductase subunit
MGLLGKIFTWWDGATIGTSLNSWRTGEQVGKDAAGNRYFRSRKGSRRWVLYHGANDASRVDPAWHGWLHGTFDELPDDSLPPPRDWQLPAGVNATGSIAAYRPAGAWSPDAA